MAFVPYPMKGKAAMELSYESSGTLWRTATFGVDGWRGGSRLSSKRVMTRTIEIVHIDDAIWVRLERLHWCCYKCEFVAEEHGFRGALQG